MSTRNSPAAPADNPCRKTGRTGYQTRECQGPHTPNHRITGSPRPTQERPARDNPAAGLRTGTTHSEPSAPAAAVPSDRDHEPGSQRSPHAPCSHLVTTTAARKPTGAPRAAGLDNARRAFAGPQATQERHSASHNHSIGTGAEQQRPPGAANPGIAPNTHNYGTGDGAKQHPPGRTSAASTERNNSKITGSVEIQAPIPSHRADSQ